MKWLRDRDAEDIGELTRKDDPYDCADYYQVVSGFISDRIYGAYFMVWNSKVQIKYTVDECSIDFDNVDDFLKLIR